MYAKLKRIGVKRWVLLLLAMTALLAAAGGVYAFITDQTTELTNRFDPVVVTCQVEEEFDGAVKKNVTIRNTGDINGFIRAKLVINWVDADGKVLPNAPVEGTDYTVEWGSNLWVKGSDGFLYHSRAVAPGSVTSHLLNSLTVVTAPAGCTLQVQIVATAIQADPPAVAENIWGATVNGYTLTPP